MRDKVLLSPGEWNDMNYSAEEIKKAFDSTDWNDWQTISLFYDHEDEKAEKWVGQIRHPYFKNGEVIAGEVIIMKDELAKQLSAGAKFGISAKVEGEEFPRGIIKDFIFKNFSVVFNPACKTSFLNRQDKNKEGVNKMTEENDEGLKTLSADTTVLYEKLNEIAGLLKENTEFLKTKIASNQEPPQPSAEDEDEEEKKKKKKEEEEKTMDEDTDKGGDEEDKGDDTEDKEELKELAAGDLFKKAKKIRKEGESFSDAIKRASKMMADEEAKLAAEKTKQTEEINELKSKVEQLSAKLNEPNRQTVKLTGMTGSSASDINADTGMLNVLHEFVGDAQ